MLCKPKPVWFFLVSSAAINLALSPTLSAAPVTAQTIAEHFSSVKSMSGDFVQSGPKAERTSGRFFLQRPGKIRFNYAGPSGVSVIADGKSLVVYNKKLKTSRRYSLSKTHQAPTRQQGRLLRQPPQKHERRRRSNNY